MEIIRQQFENGNLSLGLVVAGALYIGAMTAGILYANRKQKKLQKRNLGLIQKVLSDSVASEANYIQRMRQLYTQLEKEGRLQRYDGKYIVMSTDGEISDFDNDYIELWKRTGAPIEQNSYFLHKVGEPLPEISSETGLGLHRLYPRKTEETE